MNTQVSRRTTAQQVLERLREHILDGDYPPGAKLDETSVAKELGVSRTPLREALFGLERDGLLTHEPFRGRIVARNDDAAVAEIFPILGALEALAVRMSGAYPPETLSKLDDVNRRITEPGVSPGLRHGFDQAWHQTLVADCGNPRLIELIERHRAIAARHDGGEARGMADAPGSTADHAEIVEALRDRRNDDAAALLERHWNDGVAVVAEWRAQAAKQEKKST